MTEKLPSVRAPRLDELGQIVDSRLNRLQAALQERRPAARATLAALRAGMGKEPGQDPATWEWTGIEVTQESDEPTRAEVAIHAAMTLWASHQQSRSQNMHQRGAGLGGAVRRLVFSGSGTDENPAARARFNALVTATTMGELLHHLRGVVALLRAEEIPVDYAALADDLNQFQRDGGQSQVRRRWARQYYRIWQHRESGNNASQTVE